MFARLSEDSEQFVDRFSVFVLFGIIFPLRRSIWIIYSSRTLKLTRGRHINMFLYALNSFKTLFVQCFHARAR